MIICWRARYFPSIKTDRKTIGAPSIYGEKYYLIPKNDVQTYKKPKSKEIYQVHRRSIKEHQADEFTILESSIGRKNRAIKIEISRFNDVRIRSKKGFSMKDKPFDLIAITVVDALSGERVFQKDCFLALSGERKREIPTEETQSIYRKRFGIESFLGFNKRNLNIDNFETATADRTSS